MPYQGYAEGLYFVAQRSPTKRVYHCAILDIGNRLRTPGVDVTIPVVVHQSPPAIRADWLQCTSAWLIIHKIEDEAAAIERMKLALTDPTYALLRHNCEHFARFVAFGTWESKQLQAAGLVAGITAVAIIASAEARPHRRRLRRGGRPKVDRPSARVGDRHLS